MARPIILIMYQEKWLSAGIYPVPSKGSTIGPYPNGLRLESMPMPQWYYFGQDGVLQEFVGKQVLEAKTAYQIPKQTSWGTI